jgi:predicted transcriptional regulator
VIPVTGNGNVVGTAKEDALMHMVFENPSVLEQTTEEVMGPALPRLTPQDSVQSAIRVLSTDAPAVLVYEGTSPVGILTSIDLIGFISQ